MGKYFKGKTYVDLKEVLENRDRRREEIRKKLLIHPEKTVISYKLNIPGPEKINSGLVAIFDRGLEEITDKIKESAWDFEISEIWEAKTGKEAIILVDGDGFDVKRAMVDIEEGSSLARLFDIDVSRKGYDISRKDLGLSERKCLICDKPVTSCARSRRHSVEEMQAYIEKILEDYLS